MRKGESLSAEGDRGVAPAGENPAAFDTSVAHMARVYDYWLGGKDNFAADREAARQAIAANPGILTDVRANRAFLAHAVRYLAGECGIRQFLDIGTGIPTANNTHGVAQSVAPDCRVVYVDNDPVVLSHARALLTSDPAGVTDYIDADLRDTREILDGAARTLDFSRPVAVTLLAILHLIPDSDDPRGIVATLIPLPGHGDINEPGQAGLEDAVLVTDRPGQRERRRQVRVRAAAHCPGERGDLSGCLLCLAGASGSAFLGQYSLHAAVHHGKAADQRDDLHLRAGVKPGAGQQPEKVVQVAQPVGTGRRRAVQQARQPGVAPGDVAGLPRQVRDSQAVVRRRRWRVGVFTRDLVDHQLGQVLLGRDVVVQRHGAHAQRFCHPAHGERVEAFGIGKPDGGGGDRRAVMPWLRAALAALGKVPDRYPRL